MSVLFLQISFSTQEITWRLNLRQIPVFQNTLVLIALFRNTNTPRKKAHQTAKSKRFFLLNSNVLVSHFGRMLPCVEVVVRRALLSLPRLCSPSPVCYTRTKAVLDFFIHSKRLFWVLTKPANSPKRTQGPSYSHLSHSPEINFLFLIYILRLSDRRRKRSEQEIWWLSLSCCY